MTPVGRGFTVTVTDSVVVQFVAVVPVTVYVCVELGLAVTAATLVALNPVDGDHEYVGEPKFAVAVSPTDPPLQISGADGVMVISKLPQSAAKN